MSPAAVLLAPEPVGVASWGWFGEGVALLRAFRTAPVGVRLLAAAPPAAEAAEGAALTAAAAAPAPADAACVPAAAVPLEARFLPFFGAGLRFSFFTGAGSDRKNMYLQR